MYFDTYRLATLRIADDLRQASDQRSLRPIESDPATDRPTTRAAASTASALAGATASVAATDDCGECRSSAAA